MTNIKKILSKRLPEYVLRFLSSKIGKGLTKIEYANQKKATLLWESNFKGQSFIIFDLTSTAKIKLYNDSILSRELYEGFDKEELELMKKVLRPGDVFIDIGANVGLYSLVASKLVGNDGKIICFEPTPTTYKRLFENIELNNFKNIDAINIGLSDKQGTLSLKESKNGHDAWNTFAQYEDDKFQSSVEVKVSTLDEELLKIEKNKISFIKIDVEGWEKFVLIGGENFFKNYSPTVIMEFTESNTFSAGYFVQELYDIMESYGYKWYRYKVGILREEKKQLHYPYDNLVATKNIEGLREKIK